jgi:hypothetical protein
MDTFTFMIAILFMMIAVQFNQNWLIFAIVALMILTMRDVATTILLLIATAVLLFGRNYLMEYWPFVLFGLIILSVVLGGKQKQEQQMPDMFGQGDAGGMGFGGF